MFFLPRKSLGALPLKLPVAEEEEEQRTAAQGQRQSDKDVFTSAKCIACYHAKPYWVKRKVKRRVGGGGDQKRARSRTGARTEYKNDHILKCIGEIGLWNVSAKVTLHFWLAVSTTSLPEPNQTVSPRWQKDSKGSDRHTGEDPWLEMCRWI